jgi:BMFP domain-containing protein YqiC
MANPFLPDPPLRYWPRQPVIDTVFLDQELPSVAGGKVRDAASLVHHMSRLTELQQKVNEHYHDVVAWTEQCHSHSVALSARSLTIFTESHWLDFVRQVKEYLNEKVSRRSKEIEAAMRATVEQLASLRQSLVARLKELEVKFEFAQERRWKLLRETYGNGDT